MTKLTPCIVLATATLSATPPAGNIAQATALGAAIDKMGVSSETASPITNVNWWEHDRFFHRSFFFHHRPFFFHRFHREFAFEDRPFFFHRFHRCHWC